MAEGRCPGDRLADFADGLRHERFLQIYNLEDLDRMERRLAEIDRQGLPKDEFQAVKLETLRREFTPDQVLAYEIDQWAGIERYAGMHIEQERWNAYFKLRKHIKKCRPQSVVRINCYDRYIAMLEQGVKEEVEKSHGMDLVHFVETFGQDQMDNLVRAMDFKYVAFFR